MDFGFWIEGLWILDFGFWIEVDELLVTMFEKSSTTKVRLRLHIPSIYEKEPVISRLISSHGLIVNITGARLGKHTNGEGQFDIEIHGTVPQLRQGLNYLESLDLKIEGKPHTSGDGWYC